MRAVSGLWRWRHNPLRRTTDLVEAWVACAAAVLLVLAVPAAGWGLGGLADEAMQESVRAQAAERRPAIARVLHAPPSPGRTAADPDSAVDQRIRRPVVAEWTAPDGTRRSGRVTTAVPTAGPGDTFPIWTDRRGAPVARPMDPDTARAHSVLAGTGAAAAAAGLVEAVRRLIVRGLVQRRYEALDREWVKAGPDWGRTGAGS
ncbi:hypothetical protein QMZ92_22340 [Streptomyces sp. HNM0645]|nr:hypothetical protein [Streptomyces sp. HNM0645]MDI9887033.1 hypothetical protein [Streptomyces sp. HNM0645]